MTDPAGEPGPNDSAAVPPVEQQREELAHSVDALTKKLDVPTRVNAVADEKAHAAAAAVKDNRNVVISAVAGTALVLGGVFVIRRRRRKED